jgi:hypothetical protein
MASKPQLHSSAQSTGVTKYRTFLAPRKERRQGAALRLPAPLAALSQVILGIQFRLALSAVDSDESGDSNRKPASGPPRHLALAYRLSRPTGQIPVRRL